MTILTVGCSVEYLLRFAANIVPDDLKRGGLIHHEGVIGTNVTTAKVTSGIHQVTQSKALRVTAEHGHRGTGTDFGSICSL